VAYQGTFDVDESKGIVIHHVAAALNPNWVGTDLVRSYKFEGNKLTLSVKYAESVGVLVWERLPD
jgi:Lipocalin-like domain